MVPVWYRYGLVWYAVRYYLDGMVRWHVGIPMTVQQAMCIVCVGCIWYGIIWHVVVRYDMTGYGYGMVCGRHGVEWNFGLEISAAFLSSN